MPSGLNTLDRSISNRRSTWLVFFVITMFYRYNYTKCSVVPDQMPRSAASYMGLHCLPMSL